MSILKYKIGRAKEVLRTKLTRGYYRLKYKGMEVPWMLEIEPTNRCNANCVYCVRKYATIRPDLDIEDYYRLIDAVPFITQVHVNGFGEPLLYKNIVEMIEYAAKKGKRTLFHTNAALLTGDISRRLLEAGLSQIRLSVDSDNAEEYEQARPPLKLAKVRKNVEQFQRMRDDGKYSTTTCLGIVKSGINKHRIDEIKAFWEERVDIVTVVPMMYVPTPDEIKVPYLYSIEKPIPCNAVKEHLIVRTNGSVAMCCMGLYQEHLMGNLFTLDELTERSIIELYNNTRWKALRKSLKTGKMLPSTCVWSCGRLSWTEK